MHTAGQGEADLLIQLQMTSGSQLVSPREGGTQHEHLHYQEPGLCKHLCECPVREG